MTVGQKKKRNFLTDTRLRMTGIVAAVVLMAIAALSIITLFRMEAMNMEIAALMGENRLKRDMMHFTYMLDYEHGDLYLQDGELVDEQGVSLEYNYGVINHLAHDMGVAASIFVRENSGYRHIATNILDSNGNRAVDQYLDPENAAYPYIEAGAEYTGHAIIFGRDYLAAYRPIFQPGTNEVIGILFVGNEMSEIWCIVTENSHMRVVRVIFIGTLSIALGTLLSVTLINILLHFYREKKREEELTRAIMDTIPLGATLHDRNIDFIDCNEKIVNLFGLSSKQEFIDRFFDLSPEYQPDGRRSDLAITELANTAFVDGYCSFEWTHRKLDGEMIPCEVTLVRIKHNNKDVLATYTRDLRELDKMMKEVEQRENLLNTVNNVANTLLFAYDEKSFENSLMKSFEHVGLCLDVDRVQIWCNEMIDSEMYFVLRHQWLSKYGRDCVPVPIGLHFPYSAMPEWEIAFNEGKRINAPISALPEGDQAFLKSYGMKSIMMIPLFLEGNFWGLFSIDDCRSERKFSGEEIRLLTSVGLMISNVINRNIQTAEIREAEGRIRIMLDATPLCVMFWNSKIELIDCNQESVKFFEVSGKQEFCDRFFDLSPEYQSDGSLSRDKAVGFVKKAFEEGYIRFEWIHRKRSGEPIPCEITLVRVSYKDGFIVLGYARDLRELKAAITQISLSNRSLDVLTNMLNSINSMLYVTVPDTGEILFMNKTMLEHFNIKGNAVGQICYKILMNDKDKMCDCCPCHELNKNPDSTVLWEFRHPVTNRIYRCMDRYIEWYDGRIIHVQHSIDVTELITAKDLAEQSSRFKSQFLSRMSHEIRTPMNAILGITETQLQNTDIAPDIREGLDIINSSSYLLLGIINDILDISKIEAGRMELVLAAYDVMTVINDTVHLIAMRFGGQQIKLNIQVGEDIPATLLGDELRIKQILNNLLSNAFKYTEEGEITLTVSAEQIQDSEKRAVTLEFRVADTGQGMTAEQIDSLYKDYVRFNMESNRKTEGTGLGLSITQHLVRMMNGEIFVESEPGKGSVFTVRMPQEVIGDKIISVEDSEYLRQFQAGGSPHVKQAKQIVREYMPYGRVLIVDDVETNLYVARGLMSPYGISIETATSGFETIDKIKTGAKYDIIFMDHFMPVMDGIETAKKIREWGYSAPIVALTANAIAGQAEMFAENGFDGFMPKPIDIRQLNTVLNKLVRDKYPAEVIETARMQAEKMAKVIAEKVNSARDLPSLFVKDAEKVVARLKVIHQNAYRRIDDIRQFVIDVHSMKSALANIGEKELSAEALDLEKAGREVDKNFMMSKTPAFINELCKVIEKIRPNEVDQRPQEESQEAMAFLTEELLAIQAACEKFDEATANKALAELKLKRWQQSVNELLDNISGCLLHSDFEEAAASVGEYLKNAESLRAPS